MAKGKTAETGKPESEIEKIFAAPESQAEDFVPDDLKAMQLAQQYSGDEGIKIRVYREGKGGYRDITLLAEVLPSEFNPIMLQSEPYNGGRFRLHFVSPTGFVANMAINVAAAPQKPTASMDSQVLTVINENFKQLGEMLSRVIAPQSVVQQPTRMQLLEEMRLMAEMFRSPVAQPAQSASPLDAFKMMREFVELQKVIAPPVVATTNGEVNTTATLINVAERFFTNLLEAKKLDAERMNQQNPPPPLPVQQIAHIPATETQPKGNDEMLMFVRMLCTQAKAKGDIETYANMILDNVPEPVALEFVNAPDWFEKIASIEPEVIAHKDWFNELRAAIIEMLEPDTESNTEGLPETAPAATVQASTTADASNVAGESKQ